MEKVWEVEGLYVAAYATALEGGARFCSYAKVCLSKPANYWEADCAFKIFGGEHHSSADAALTCALLRARLQINHAAPRAMALLEYVQRRQRRGLLGPLASMVRLRPS